MLRPVNPTDELAASDKDNSLNVAQNIVTDDDEESTTTEAKIYKCQYPNCGMAFTRSDRRNRHMLSHYDDKNFRCTICYKTFKTAQNLAKHLHRHEDPLIFKCELCEAAYRQKKQLHKHYESHDVSLFSRAQIATLLRKCPYCDANIIFTYPSHVTRHLAGCHPQEALTDKIINQDDIDSYNVLKEKASKNKTSSKPTPVDSKDSTKEPGICVCEECGKIFSAKRNLVAHKKVAHENLRFSCPHCDKEYTSKQRLKLHISQVHMNEKGAEDTTLTKKLVGDSRVFRTDENIDPLSKIL